MFLAHSFRLRHPWDCERVDDSRVRWSRGFHRPTGMETSDTLWIVISGLPDGCRVWLNDELLDGPKRGQFEVTEVVGDANRIVIECPGNSVEKFPFDVRLGIVGNE